jgi:hypothetical protein
VPRPLASLATATALATILVGLTSQASGASAGGFGDDCPGQFAVFQKAPAGPVTLQGTSYTITILNNSTNCYSASEAFASFIGHTELPPPWTADPRTKVFTNGIERFLITATGPQGTGPGGAPSCPTFSVLEPDDVGPLTLPKGQYAIEPSGESRLSCLDAARLLAGILDHPSGKLPARWSVGDAPAARPAVILRHRSGHSVQVSRLHGHTAGGGRTPCRGCR